MMLVSDVDPRQALRIRRYFMALGASAMVLALLGLAAWAGVIDSATLTLACAFAAAYAVAFYLMFWRGWNLRFDDPSLTAAMMIAALSVLLFTISRAGAGHAALLSLIPVAYLFGVFRLDWNTMLAISAGVSLTYAAILAVHGVETLPGENVRLVALYWVLLTAVIVFFSVLGGYISRLRKRLSASKRDLEQAFGRIEHMVSYDLLTGLYNRRRITEILDQERNRCVRFGTLFSICLLDIDYFKQVNDTWGHAVGDAVLRGFAGTVSATLRDADFLGRMGGEEFLAVFSGTLLDGAAVGAERMRAAVSATRFTGAPEQVQVTVSVGVACYRSGETIEELLARADAALYRAKNAGRNRIVTAAA